MKSGSARLLLAGLLAACGAGVPPAATEVRGKDVEAPSTYHWQQIAELRVAADAKIRIRMGLATVYLAPHDTITDGADRRSSPSALETEWGTRCPVAESCTATACTCALQYEAALQLVSETRPGLFNGPEVFETASWSTSDDGTIEWELPARAVPGPDFVLWSQIAIRVNDIELPASLGARLYPYVRILRDDASSVPD